MKLHRAKFNIFRDCTYTFFERVERSRRVITDHLFLFFFFLISKGERRRFYHVTSTICAFIYFGNFIF